MSNALFYGVLGFTFLIFTGCIGVWAGKFLARRRLTYEAVDGEDEGY